MLKLLEQSPHKGIKDILNLRKRDFDRSVYVLARCLTPNHGCACGERHRAKCWVHWCGLVTRDLLRTMDWLLFLEYSHTTMRAYTCNSWRVPDVTWQVLCQRMPSPAETVLSQHAVIDMYTCCRGRFKDPKLRGGWGGGEQPPAQTIVKNRFLVAQKKAFAGGLKIS